jgi:flagellar basal body P-ring protein FlgI
MDSLSKKVELRKDKVVVMETREIEFADNKGIEELKQKLKMELSSIVRSVKSLKARAEEIKGILGEIEKQEKEAGPAKDPA